MNPGAPETQKYPEGSEVKKIDEQNKALRKLLKQIEKKNPNSEITKEYKIIKEYTGESLNDLKSQIDPNYQNPDLPENQYLGINEDNLPTDENGNPVTPDMM